MTTPLSQSISLDYRPLESDFEYLDKLRELVANGHIRVVLDVATLDGMTSPVCVQAEMTRWVWGGLILMGVGWWFFGWWGAAVAVAAVVAAYQTIGKKAIARNIRRRVLEALKSIATWRRLWRFGGVTLEAGGEHCAAPQDSWVRFVDGILRQSSERALRS